MSEKGRDVGAPRPGGGRAPGAAAGAPASPADAAKGSDDVEPVSVSAATAITHFGPECPSCAKVNHPGTLRCVFCGHMFVAAAPPPPQPAWPSVEPPQPAWPSVEPPQPAWPSASPPRPASPPASPPASAVAPRANVAPSEPPPSSTPLGNALGPFGAHDPGATHGPALTQRLGSSDVPPPLSTRGGGVGHVELRYQNADASAQSALTGSQISQPNMRRSTWSTPFDDLQMPVADPLIGVVVADRYRIVEGLGRGGMGIVYKVEHKQIGKLLAMKLLTGELSRNPEVVRRFKHEALTSSRLSNPNTVQVFDFGVSDGLTYLVMELIAGEDLGRILRAGGPMPWSRLGKVIVQACSSLAEAHSKGIVHRDIKPENIMLVKAKDGSDIAKVLDFGLAKLREGEGLSELTSAGAIVGTPYFMSPEQVRGDPVDARSDIYSLGALMYRALTGHYPFNGPTPMSVFTKHLTEMPAAPVDRSPELGIPPGVSRIVMKALLKNPAERFQKVEDLQVAVVEQLRALGTSSVDTLLDSGAVRKLGTATPKAAPGGAAIATRDEVERYERKLRRQKYGAYGVLVVLLAGAGAGGAKYAQSRQHVFSGVEVEPNNAASEATPVPFGRAVLGYLGPRIAKDHGDRDFFEIDVPGPAGGGAVTFVSVEVTALPNIPMCTMLYRSGFTTQLGQYCVGRAGRNLVIPALRLEPGRYFVAVLQDMDPYGIALPPYTHENVSDPYTVMLKTVDRPVGVETEPNDQVASAGSLGVGESVTGALSWARDEDVYCVHAAAGERVAFRVTDTARDAGSVIEVTPLRGTEESAKVRVHVIGKGTVTSSDVVGPWTTAAVTAEPDVPRCIRVRQTLDPWVSARGNTVPAGSSESYQIEVVEAD